MKKYWYFITVDVCPVCGREQRFRSRRFTPRPKRWEDRHDFNYQAYDWCMG